MGDCLRGLLNADREGSRYAGANSSRFRSRYSGGRVNCLAIAETIDRRPYGEWLGRGANAAVEARR